MTVHAAGPATRASSFPKAQYNSLQVVVIVVIHYDLLQNATLLAASLDSQEQDRRRANHILLDRDLVSRPAPTVACLGLA